MSLWVIGDLHLPFGAAKPMDIFGGGWDGYVSKIERNWRRLVAANDTVAIAGDLSWGMSLEQSLPDFCFLDSLPGQKILVKGNHDYYWTTVAKMTRFLRANGIGSIRFLHNNSYEIDGVGLCGTRGWFLEESGEAAQQKIYQRELLRLEASLKSCKTKFKTVVMHYPPVYKGSICSEIIDMFKAYNVVECCYGHLHGEARRGAVAGMYDGVNYRLVSADNVDFEPVRIFSANATDK
jgi:predicted phosphohydrolase